MPRPKGSKNKKTVSIQENVEDKIAAVEAEIAELGTQLKAKKAELKQLVKAKAESDRIAAERKAEEDKKAIVTRLFTCKITARRLRWIIRFLRPMCTRFEVLPQITV